MSKIENNGIWKFEGAQAGPCIGVLGGIHGNELTGIEVVKRLRDQFESGILQLQAGTLYLILGNLEAIEKNQRATAIENDLNRMFSETNLSGQGRDCYEAERARELAPILRQLDISLDLHATNKPSDPFLCVVHDPPGTREIMSFFSADQVITDPNYILAGEPATTDELVFSSGGLGLCYETGWAKDTSRADQVLENVLNILSSKGMTSGSLSSVPEFDKTVYEITKRINLTEAGWSFADNFGQKNFEPFESGQTIGYHGEDPETPDYDGVTVFPKIKEHWKIGFPVCFLAKENQDGAKAPGK
ncbi:MAG: succinylglutamate desuccinylase/aspartoacylase family protein [Candidatus Uhrbacteria bacterium]